MKKINLFPTKEEFAKPSGDNETGTIDPAILAEQNSSLQEDLVNRQGEVIEAKTEVALDAVSELQEDISDVDALMQEVKEHPENGFANEQLSKKLVSVSKKYGIKVPDSYMVFSKESYADVSTNRRNKGLKDSLEFLKTLKDGAKKGVEFIIGLFKKFFAWLKQRASAMGQLMTKSGKTVMTGNQHMDALLKKEPKIYNYMLKKEEFTKFKLGDIFSNPTYGWSLNNIGNKNFTLDDYVKFAQEKVLQLFNDYQSHYKTIVYAENYIAGENIKPFLDWWSDISKVLNSMGISKEIKSIPISLDSIKMIFSNSRERTNISNKLIHFTITKDSFNPEPIQKFNNTIVMFHNRMKEAEKYWTDPVSVEEAITKRGVNPDFVQAILGMFKIYQQINYDLCTVVSKLAEHQNKVIEIPLEEWLK